MRHNWLRIIAEMDNALPAHEYDADSLYKHAVTGWSDAKTPKTGRPVRFKFVFTMGRGFAAIA